MANVAIASEPDRGSADKTSVQVYASDATWLREKQREVSFRRGTYVPMFDLVRELINQVRDAGEGA